MATLRLPDDVPSPRLDCERLKRSFQGLGTDENSVIRVLGHRSASQRRKIRETYQQLYNKSLIDEFHSELSGDFGPNGLALTDFRGGLLQKMTKTIMRGLICGLKVDYLMKAVIMWTYDPSERDAKLANGTLKSRGKGVHQLQVIVEIACASSPHHLVAVRQAYVSLFDCSLEEDIISNVPMPLQKVLVNLVRSYRYDKVVVDSDVANSEAAKLYEVIKTKKLDEDDFISILSTRNVFQLKETFRFYEKNYGNPIDEDIMKCGKGTLESILKVIIWCIDTPEKHFAEVIRASIVGLGTDENSLTRAILSRAEIDMLKVREEYFNRNKSSLDDAVIGDTSGDYQRFLVTLLGRNI